MTLKEHPMQTHTFKTNINCGGCLKAVTPTLDQLSDAWQVDTSNPDKILTITTDKPTDAIIRQVEKAGFTATQHQTIA
jgi:copper chaperone